MKMFLKERGLAFREINIEVDAEGEAIVLRENHGRRKVPTIHSEGRYFACSPFNAQKLASELNIPLNR